MGKSKTGWIRDALVVLTAGAVFAGCGAAYYGTAIAIFVTQKKKTTVDTSFPDAVPTAAVTPPFATLALSGVQVTVTRSDTGGFVLPTTPQTSAVTDFAVTGLSFPAGLGEARSNRDTGETLVAGDKLFLRLNGDAVQALTFSAAETATIGSATAAAIQSKVRVLTPTQAGVPAAAYQLFTASFDRTTRSYLFQSGAPGEASEVVWQPAPRSGTTDPELDASSQVTAERLGLGVANGGQELAGAESIRFQVLNRGDDVISQGTKVRLYLSLDKILSLGDDIPFDEVEIPATIAVGESRQVTRRNGTAPPVDLVRGDFRDTSYYVLFSVANAGEKVLTNNEAFSLGRVQIYQPIDDPATSAVEAALALDFAPTQLSTQIGILAGDNLSATVGVTNLGENVGASGAALDLDLTLSADTVFDSPAAFRDPSGVLAGIRINPRNPNRPARIVVNKSGTGPLAATVFADTITVAYNSGAGVATVQSMIAALNASSGNLVEAFHDGLGATTELLDPLITASTVTEQTAKDIFVATQRVTFTQTTRLQEERVFRVDGVIRDAFDTTAQPAKLRPFVRVRPVVAATGGVNENTKNNVRRGRNFLRVYARSSAFFDADTGTLLPTRGSVDFAKLDAVSQRPVNTGSISQGQQRVFSFTIPATGASTEESQLLIVVRSSDFDAHLDLLSGTGKYLAGNDDIGLGNDPVVYSSALVPTGGNRTFYLIVSPARFDEADLAGGDETFELTISVNSRAVADPALLTATKGDNLLRNATQRYEPQATAARTRNNVLLPYSLANRRAEVMFVLPQRARLRFRSTPIANSGITTTITQFLQGQVPSPVEFQAEFDPGEGKIVYRPTGKGANASHLLPAGVYTVAFDGSLADTSKFRLEVDTEFVPDTVVGD